jgi:RNA polymerase sigma-70 factor (ECF subfamily)
MIRDIRKMTLKFNNGDEIDLKDFFYTYYPALSAFASKYIVDNTVCEDIIQDVFISFWEKQKTFPNLNAAKAFFYTSVRNSCLDQIKHNKVKAKYLEYNSNKEQITESFLDEVIRKEAYSEIYREINKLPEMGKKVLLLALLEKSNEEISKILDIALNTVKTHKARAYKVLRKNLNELFLLFFPFHKR